MKLEEQTNYQTSPTMLRCSTLNTDGAGSASVSCNVVFVLNSVQLRLEEEYLELVVLSRLIVMAQVIFEDERAIGSSALCSIVDTLGGICIDIQVIPVRQGSDAREGCCR